MSDIAIRVEGLSKRYRLGQPQRYKSLRESLASAVSSAIKGITAASSGQPTNEGRGPYIWALKDVSFEVTRGEIAGIIGRNGAGKSTLLKILSRITEPTSGYARIRGRVGSLLEVGTGFHPELTGRENIYLNGAILGMKKKEIDRKFDDIVQFAEIERFIDTPVKHYSSGMYVRLAFAVAAHLETEILLVDEVLAVGDAAFQKKCLGKMADVAGDGRTVLFVSHNMGAITSLCKRAIWLDEGLKKLDGPASSVIRDYLSVGNVASSQWRRPSKPIVLAGVCINSVQILQDGRLSSSVRYDEEARVLIEYDVLDALRDVSVLLRITDALGNVLLTTWDTDTTAWRGRRRPPGTYQSLCIIPPRLLRPGHYWITVGAHIHNVRVLDYWENVLTLEVSTAGYPFNPDRLGVVAPVLSWEVAKCN